MPTLCQTDRVNPSCCLFWVEKGPGHAPTGKCMMSLKRLPCVKQNTAGPNAVSSSVANKWFTWPSFTAI
eukprot:3171723-Amphidinium_carterae.2